VPLVSALDAYLRRIVDRDLPDAGYNLRRPGAVTAWLRAYGAATGTTTTWDKIRDAATPNEGDKPGKTSTQAYTELLTALRILDPLEAWYGGFGHLGALGRSSKHYLADPALAARLLRRNEQHLLNGVDGPVSVPRDGTLLGALFEHLALLSVRVYAQRVGATVSHMRTSNGAHEVDAIVEGRNGELLAIEVKLKSSIDDHDVHHLRWLRGKLGDDLTDTVVLSTGSDAYRRSDGVAVVPLALLGP
jgi:predicted AAA+ superfamily ATPase